MRSTQRPQLVNEAKLSLLSLAATVMLQWEQKYLTVIIVLALMLKIMIVRC